MQRAQARSATQGCVLIDLTGLTLEEATAKLVAAGCKLGDVTVDPDAEPEDGGKVTDQTPDPGSYPPGTEVDLVIGGPIVASAPASSLPIGSTVDVTLGAPQVRGVQVAAAAVPTETGGQTLALTGGIALAGLSLWLLASGLTLRLASATRLRRHRQP